eukprot:gene29726-33492_t
MRLKQAVMGLASVGIWLACMMSTATADDIADKAEEGYLYLMMRDMKSGARNNELMQSILADLTREDLHALASYFAAKPWPRFDYSSSDQDRQAAALVMSAGVCTSCHLEGLKGDATVPRLANQQAEYLLKTMNDFRSRARPNNPFMSDLLNSYKQSDIDAMARYLASLQ